MIEILRSTQLFVSGLPSGLRLRLQEALTVPNPAYHKIARITGNEWAAARDFKYFKQIKGTDTIAVPLGFEGRLRTYLQAQGLKYEYVDNSVDKLLTLWISTEPELRDYQIPIVQAMVDAPRGGLVMASTGVGKTVLVLSSIRRQKKTAIILARNTVDLNQYVRKAKDMYGFVIGQYHGTKKDIQDVTVTTWNSLGDLELHAERFSHIYIDEVHTAVSDGRMEALSKFKPSKIYGLSGSPRRSKDDGRTDVIQFIVGSEIYRYAQTQLKPTIVIQNSHVDVPVFPEYNETVDALVEHDGRNTLICGLALGEALQGKKVLILCKRKKHCELLQEKLPKGQGVIYIDSDDKGRNDLLESLSMGDQEFSILIGTVSLIGTGTDIPSLDTLIIASDMRSDVILEQGAGRILRMFEGKPTPKIYDIVDNRNPILSNHARERMKFYKTIGWEVIV